MHQPEFLGNPTRAGPRIRAVCSAAHVSCIDASELNLLLQSLSQGLRMGLVAHRLYENQDVSGKTEQFLEDPEDPLNLTSLVMIYCAYMGNCEKGHGGRWLQL